MTTKTQRADAVERRFLEQEHREIHRGVNRLTDVAELAGSLASADLGTTLQNLLGWLHSSLQPHAAWEEQWLYPRLDERAHSPWPTRLLRFEHEQIRRAIAALEVDRDALRREPTHQRLVELRARLYGLDALIRAHLEREDRFLLPELDDLDESRPSSTEA
jgi:hemerythrin-like domain-containing protein